MYIFICNIIIVKLLDYKFYKKKYIKIQDILMLYYENID